MQTLRNPIRIAAKAFVALACGTSMANPTAGGYIDFSIELANPNNITNGWGLKNISLRNEEGIQGQVLDIFFPEGSLDPRSMWLESKPYGGVGFRRKIFKIPVDCASLSYKIRFPENFDFVKGGKLPGFFGGSGNSGGKIPTGSDGFSTRYMWLSGGRGQVYAYLPTSINYGTPFKSPEFIFIRGVWNTLKQEVQLNDPGKDNGTIKVWLNKSLVINQNHLRFRDIQRLGIDGIFFETFFGGNDDSWRNTRNTYISFAEFEAKNCSPLK